MCEKRATVLMCTYNAHDFILKQLNSLINQTYENISIIIYDDASTDNTTSIIQNIIQIEEKHRDIKLTINSPNSGGAKENFRKIITNNLQEDYVFFCDQDDVWELDKVAIMMQKMNEMEREGEKPYLICHNCSITNEFDQITSHKSIKSVCFYDMIFNPGIQGCCMMLNHTALSILKIDKAIICMHDWYIGLMISIKGQIVVIEKELLQYRQHENNLVGYKKESLFDHFRLVFNNGKKVNLYSGILKQLYSVAQNVDNHEFLCSYKKTYDLKAPFKMLRLFLKYGVISPSVHGLYKGYMSMKALVDQTADINK